MNDQWYIKYDFPKEIVDTIERERTYQRMMSVNTMTYGIVWIGINTGEGQGVSTPISCHSILDWSRILYQLEWIEV